jgi:hypothetical protein
VRDANKERVNHSFPVAQPAFFNPLQQILFLSLSCVDYSSMFAIQPSDKMAMNFAKQEKR